MKYKKVMSILLVSAMLAGSSVHAISPVNALEPAGDDIVIDKNDDDIVVNRVQDDDIVVNKVQADDADVVLSSSAGADISFETETGRESETDADTESETDMSITASPVSDNQNTEDEPDIVLGEKKQFTASVERISDKKDLDTGDTAKLRVTASNPTEQKAVFKLYFVDGELPKDTSDWKSVLQNPALYMTVKGLNKDCQLPVDITDADGQVTDSALSFLKEVKNDEIVSRYAKIELPAGVSIEFEFSMTCDVECDVTVIPVIEQGASVYGEAESVTYEEKLTFFEKIFSFFSWNKPKDDDIVISDVQGTEVEVSNVVHVQIPNEGGYVKVSMDSPIRRTKDEYSIEDADIADIKALCEEYGYAYLYALYDMYESEGVYDEEFTVNEISAFMVDDLAPTDDSLTFDNPENDMVSTEVIADDGYHIAGYEVISGDDMKNVDVTDVKTFGYDVEMPSGDVIIKVLFERDEDAGDVAPVHGAGYHYTIDEKIAYGIYLNAIKWQNPYDEYFLSDVFFAGKSNADLEAMQVRPLMHYTAYNDYQSNSGISLFSTGTYNAVSSQDINTDAGTVTHFSVTDGSASYNGYCADHGKPAVTGTLTNITEITSSTASGAMIRKAIYYNGYSDWSLTSDRYTQASYDSLALSTVTHLIVSAYTSWDSVNTASLANWDYEDNRSVYQRAEGYETFLLGKSIPAEDDAKLRVWRGTPEDDSNGQRVVFWSYGYEPEYEEQYTSLSVSKVWNDNNNALNTRPSSISVTLLRNGTTYDTATLSSPSWSKAWSGLVSQDTSGNTYTYSVSESSVSGYESNVSVVGTSATITNTLNTGYLKVYKASADTGKTSGNSNYSLEGAKFDVYTDAACTTKATYSGTLETNSSGETGTIEILPGTYYVKETTASKGYSKAGAVSVTVTADHTSSSPARVDISEPPKTVKISLIKTSKYPDITDGNRCYSLAGAEYTVYKDSGCSQSVGTITTDLNGKGYIEGLPLGKYYVKETTASMGYELDTTVYTADCSSGDADVVEYTVESTEKPKNDPGSIMIQKIWNGPQTQTVPTLEGTQFTVKYYDQLGLTKSQVQAMTPTKTWILEVRKLGNTNLYAANLAESSRVVGSDEFYKQSDGKIVIPRGTITIQETKPAEGYTLDGYLKDRDGNIISSDSELYMSEVTDGSYGFMLQAGNEFSAEDDPKRSDIKIRKYGNDGKTLLPGVQYTITHEDGSEVTDMNGNVIGTQTTNSNGEVHFTDLYPDIYVVKEVKTVSGLQLLKEPITIACPMRVTEQEIIDKSIDKDQCIYDPADDIYYIFSQTYEVTDHNGVIMVLTGGTIDAKVFILLALGMAVFTVIAVILFRKKKKLAVNA